MANTLNSSTRGSDQASATILLKSFTGDQWYNISLDKRTCSCPQFVATLLPCKHLNALGIYSTPRPFVARTHPTFSQALSAVVMNSSTKAMRLVNGIYSST